MHKNCKIDIVMPIMFDLIRIYAKILFERRMCALKLPKSLWVVISGIINVDFKNLTKFNHEKSSKRGAHIRKTDLQDIRRSQKI